MTTKNIGPAKGKTAVEAIVTGVAAIAALVLMNVLVCGSHGRVDLTENKIYSLSDASKDIVRKMPEKVTIKAYFGNVPAEHEEKQKFVEMLLEEYEAASGGKVTYEKIDPWNNKQLQEDLKKDGVNVIRLLSRSNDKTEQVPMYFHVVFQHLDQKEIWTPGQGFTLEGLEYEFTARIKRMGYGKKNVGVTQGFGEPQQIQALQLEGREVMPGVKIGLGDLYDVQPVDWKKDPTAIDKVDVLIVNGPTQKISDEAKYQLDQYVMKGKPVLFLVHGMVWSNGNQQQQMPGMDPSEQPYLGTPAEDGLKDLLAAYGFQIDPDVVIDEVNNAPGIVPPDGGQLLAPAFFPLVESVPRDKSGILAGIEAMVTPFASTVKLVGPLASGQSNDDTKIQILLRSSPRSWSRANVMAISQGMHVERTDKDPKGAQPIAYAVAAKFPSLYATQAPPAGVTEQPLKESAAHTRVIVVASPTMVADATLMMAQRLGPAFEAYVSGLVGLHDMVDWLVEDTQLVAVRAKTVERPIKQLSDGTKTLVKYGNIAGAPLLLILLGIIGWRVRERKRRSITL